MMSAAPAWLKGKKVAIVTDWLTTYGGAEKVVKSVHEIFPEAPIFTSQYAPKQINWFDDCDVRTGWVDIFPSSLRKILMVPRAIYFSRLHKKLTEYDVIITICIAESKAVKIAPHQTGVCYLQGPPTQYYWGMYDDYVKNPGFGKLNFLVRFFFKLLVGPLRRQDYKFAKRPTHLVANSSYSADESLKYYGRQATVVFPPVDIYKFTVQDRKPGDFFITTSRQVNWKRLDLAVEACRETGQKLKLVGTGAEHDKLVELAAGDSNIEFIPAINDPGELAKLVAGAKGFLFPSQEPFGIAPIEALSAGVPVLAYRKGGALDYIKDGENGVFFDEQTVESLAAAIEKFNHMKFDKQKVADSAKPFSEENFKQSLIELVKSGLARK